MDPTTSSLATSTLGGPKIKIQQSVPSGSVKKGPPSIVRSAALNDGIEIVRRYGEGTKPLFARDDIAVNQATIESHDNRLGHDRNSGCKSKSIRRSSSTKSSSPERFRHRDVPKHSSPSFSRRKSPERSSRHEITSHNRDKNAAYNVKYENHKTDKHKRREKSKSRSPATTKKKPTEKVPYYRDEQREKDRIKHLYGRSRSSPPRPPATSSSSKRYCPIRRPIDIPPRRRRSSSREKQRWNSPYRSSRRDYKSRRSRTRSRTRSPQRRDRHWHAIRSSRGHDKEQKEGAHLLSTSVMPATPQFIPIPVAVPADYAAYSFPGWSTPQAPWHPSHHRPPMPGSHFGPFPILSMMPSMRPQQGSYNGMPSTIPYIPYRPQTPQRYPPPRHNTNNYQPRSKRP